MSSPGITQSDREQLEALAARDTRGNIGTILTCGTIRHRYKHGTPKEKLAEENDVKEKRIHEHLRGLCACETDEPPLETTGEGKRERKHCPHGCGFSRHRLEDLTEHIREVHSCQI